MSSFTLIQANASRISALRTLGTIPTPKRRRKNAKRRQLRVPAMEQHVANPIVCTLSGRRANFGGVIDGALVNRSMGQQEQIRVYNPNTTRWECYPLKDWESRFGPMTNALAMGEFALIRDVYYCGVDYTNTWSPDRVNVAIRVITPK